jgi:hypothetical protein
MGGEGAVFLLALFALGAYQCLTSNAIETDVFRHRVVLDGQFSRVLSDVVFEKYLTCVGPSKSKRGLPFASIRSRTSSTSD